MSPFMFIQFIVYIGLKTKIIPRQIQPAEKKCPGKERAFIPQFHKDLEKKRNCHCEH